MTGNQEKDIAARVIGRYAIYGVIASGGMATVHYGRLIGPAGFSRTVAIKRLHSHYATDPDFVTMFLDEARLAARIRHPNVVPTIDIVTTGGELFLVMDYVPGETLSRIWKTIKDAGRPIPHRIITTIMSGVLHGLHAAHEAHDEKGAPLNIVHRDVSPQNVHIGVDGTARVLDFGVAKAAGRIQTTREGQIKGKLAYMAPEQLRGEAVTRASDIYSAGVMLWELLTGQRLFHGDNEGVIVARVLAGHITPPSEVLLANGPVGDRTLLQLKRLDSCVLRALHGDPKHRFATARDMALELEACVASATVSQVGDWVETNMTEVLRERAACVAEIESLTTPPPFERPSDVQDAINAADQPVTPASQISPGSATSPGPYPPASPVPVPPQTAPLSTVSQTLQVQGGALSGPSPSVVSTSTNGARSESISASTPRRGSRVMWPILLLGLSGLLLVLGGAGWATISKYRAGGESTDDSGSASPDPTSVNVPTLDVRPDASSGADQPSPTATALPTKPDGGRPAGSVRWVPRHADTGTKTPGPATVSTPPPPRNDCDPPWTIEDGIKIYKKNCMGKK